jgi:5-methylcytosine-specific restriction endonuclease McrA
MSLCEVCKTELGSEVHHLQHQKDANSKGIITKKNTTPFHKNTLANLVTLCEKCHDKFHSENVQHKKVKTSKGYKIIEEISS